MLKFSQRLTHRALGGGLAAFLYLVLQLFAASPELHHLFHKDSNQPNHQCAIKLLSDGQVDIEPGDFGPRIPDQPLMAESFLAVFAPTQVDYQLPPGRAPPSSRS